MEIGLYLIGGGASRTCDFCLSDCLRSAKERGQNGVTIIKQSIKKKNHGE